LVCLAEASTLLAEPALNTGNFSERANSGMAAKNRLSLAMMKSIRIEIIRTSESRARRHIIAADVPGVVAKPPGWKLTRA
jgi:hypothetical protein